MTNEQHGDMTWKQCARNPGEHRIHYDEVSGYFVKCAACGFDWNPCHRIECSSCGADGIAEAARIYFAGRGKKEKKMNNDFSDAVDRLPQDRPKQYIFTCEVVIRESDLRDEVLEDAAAMIRQIGSFEVADVQELDEKDERRL